MRNLFILLLLGSTLACQGERSQVVLSIDLSPNLGAPCDVDQIAITVNGNRVGAPIGISSSAALPITLTIVPGSTSRADVRVEGLRGGTVVTAATTVFQIRDGAARTLPIQLDANCATGCAVDGNALVALSLIPSTSASGSCTMAGDSGPGRVVYEAERVSIPFDDACERSGASGGAADRYLQGAGGTGTDSEEVVLSLADLDNFRFEIYGTPADSIVIGDNGYVAFDNRVRDGRIDLPDSTISLDNTQTPLIAGFWRTLQTRGGGVCVALQQTLISRDLLITWKGVCPSGTCASTNENISFTVTLRESSGSVGYEIDIAMDPSSSSMVSALNTTDLGGVVGIANGEMSTCSGACDANGDCVGDGATGVCSYTEIVENERLAGWRLRPRREP